MALFRKHVPPEQYGLEVLRTAHDWLGSDLLNALGRCYPNFNPSKGWRVFFEQFGIGGENLKTYLRMGMHCSVQSCFTQFDPDLRRRLVSGAIALFEGQTEGYHFESFYDKLDRALEGERVFADNVARLSADCPPLSFLPGKYQNSALTSSKMLIEEFVYKRLKDPQYVNGNFESFCFGILGSISTAQRAENNVARDLKM